METGKRSPTKAMLSALDNALDADGELRTFWERLTGSGRPAYIEEIATTILHAEAVYEYQVLTWPAHLQSQVYVEACMRLGTPWISAEERSRRAAERAAYAEAVTSSSTPHLWLVVDSSLLERRYGGDEVALKQLSFILDLVDRDRLTFQVIPAGSPRHPGDSGVFKLITTDTGQEVGYVESRLEGQVTSSPQHVAHWRMLFAALQSAALTPEASRDALRKEIQVISSE
ncbi:hypothetical protein CLV72_101289 [Allonocardiopsis opalescens]|uniref:DUF5753 domain-containing protein n=2 Tax=Allonocardiopsis opalescens TaxID=1144618 RepID=A0A2T0QCS1_9ACTN|nr:hypothetical protein CLV72_101289 [Allonocardiopsis opalescens]